MHGLDDMLKELERDIRAEPKRRLTPMCGDVWLLLSAMHKAIRRGEEKQALGAAVSLWRQDRVRFWRRLPVIACEDVSIGNPQALIKTLTAAASPAWRKDVGDLEAGLHLVRLLCAGAKSRLTDAAYIMAERAAELAPLRKHLASASDELLAGYVADDEAPLAERCLAAWMLAGTNTYPSEHLPPRKGKPAEAISALQALPIPAPLLQACVNALRLSRYPLAAFIPLIAAEAQKHELSVVHETIPDGETVEGVPMHCLDIFTRGGQASLRELQQSVREMREYSIRQLGLCLFYLEGQRTNQRLTSDALEAFQQQGELADMEGAGLGVPEYLGLRECMQKHMPLLDEIRRRRLERQMEGVA